MKKIFGEIIGEAAKVGQMLWQRGWAEKNAGNLSHDVTSLLPAKPAKLKGIPFRKQDGLPREMAGRSFLVTGTGTRFRDIEKNAEGCLCVLRLDEKAEGYHILWGGKGGSFKPTSELSSHLRMQSTLFHRGGGMKTVLHTHPNELIALTHLPETNNQQALNQALWGMIPEAKLFVPKGVGLVPYELTGSEALARATVKVLDEGYQIVLWEKHGALAVGKGPDEAFDLIEAMNKAATLYLLCRHAGAKPQGLTAEQIEEIGRTYPPKD